MSEVSVKAQILVEPPHLEPPDSTAALGSKKVDGWQWRPPPFRE